MPVPTSAGDVIAACTGHWGAAPCTPPRNITATSPGLMPIAESYGSSVSPGPAPLGLRVNDATGSDWPMYSTLTWACVDHVFATNTAKQFDSSIESMYVA